MLLNKRIPLTYILNKIKYDLVIVFAIGVLLLTLTYKFHLTEFSLAIPVLLVTALISGTRSRIGQLIRPQPQFAPAKLIVATSAKPKEFYLK